MWGAFEDRCKVNGHLRHKDGLYYDIYGHMYEIKGGEYLTLRLCVHLKEGDFSETKDDEMLNLDGARQIRADELSEYLSLLMGIWSNFAEIRDRARGIGIHFEAPEYIGTDPTMYHLMPSERFLAIPMSKTPFAFSRRSS